MPPATETQLIWRVCSKHYRWFSTMHLSTLLFFNLALFHQAEQLHLSIQIRLGSAKSICGQLDFTFVVRSGGAGHLQIYARDPTDLRKAGVLLTLGHAEYQQLKELIARTDQTIERLRTSKQMRRMLVQLE